jgi:DNA-binding beta-propeller fold protein YncE
LILSGPSRCRTTGFLGQTIGVSVDGNDHIWIIHRAGSLEPGERHATTNPQIAQCCAPAPPVLEFDQQGNLIGHWGGAGNGYDWPDSNHGITVDYKGFVWIGGNGRGNTGGRGAIGGSDEESAGETGQGRAGRGGFQTFNDNMILKFTQDGKFVMQIGKPAHSKGSNDIENLRLPAKTFIDPKTDELYVADGYGNHRVIVFDANTGKYKRHWGAYGNKPDDTDMGRYNPNDPPPQQFRNPVHCAELSHDDLLYVCDRVNDRLQIFKPDGTFVKEKFYEKETLGSGSAWDLAFSRDPQQKYMYLADGENDRVHVIDRESLEVLTSFGEGGRQPGEFYGVHSIATDSKGNIYTTETYRGQRLQKFVYKGLAPVGKRDQGVVWPKAAGK